MNQSNQILNNYFNIYNLNYKLALRESFSLLKQISSS